MSAPISSTLNGFVDLFKVHLIWIRNRVNLLVVCSRSRFRSPNRFLYNALSFAGGFGGGVVLYPLHICNRWATPIFAAGIIVLCKPIRLREDNGDGFNIPRNGLAPTIAILPAGRRSKYPSSPMHIILSHCCYIPSLKSSNWGKKKR